MMKNKYIWFLGIAIAIEICATTLLALSNGMSRLLPAIIALLAYTISYYFLMRSLKKIPIGIAYAIWSGLGIVATKTINHTLFGAPLHVGSLLGIAMIVSGVLVINLLANNNLPDNGNKDC